MKGIHLISVIPMWAKSWLVEAWQEVNTLSTTILPSKVTGVWAPKIQLCSWASCSKLLCETNYNATNPQTIVKFSMIIIWIFCITSNNDYIPFISNVDTLTILAGLISLFIVTSSPIDTCFPYLKLNYFNVFSRLMTRKGYLEIYFKVGQWYCYQK